MTLCLLLLFMLTACDSIKNLREISYEGTQLTIILGSKISGYKWDYEIDGDCVQADIGGKFEIVGLTKGKDYNVFEGLHEGNATIVFTTHTGWDGTGEGDIYIVGVSVGEDGTILSAEEVDTQ